MRDVPKKYAVLLPPAVRRKLGWLCLIAAASGLLETATVASIVPFLSVLSRPELASADPRIAAVIGIFGASEPSHALAVLGAAVLLLLVVSNACSAATQLAMLRFAHRQGHALAVRLLEAYLGQPYSFHLHRHTAELQKNVLNEVYRITVGLLTPAVLIIGRAFVIVFIVALMVVADPLLTLAVGGVLGAGYLAVFAVVRSMLRSAGRESLEAGTRRAVHAQESLQGVKEIQLLGRERDFIARFEASSRRWADAQAKAQALSALPRYAVETAAFGFVLIAAIYLLASAGSMERVLPMLGLYAFAGYRLMPALHQVFEGWALLRYSGAALELVRHDLQSAHEAAPRQPAARGALAFDAEIALKDVAYRYPGGADWAVRGLNLRIAKNSSVALVGPTGCGKTTVIDLLMGLLPPTEGRLEVDGTTVDGARVRSWQDLIGHVPQQIFLCDDTVARNIAFGVADQTVDMARVERAARLARLHDFVATLPQRYDTPVGERGVRLSGGQRQRIGIARALYHDPSLIVLDEATAALDNVTENAVLDALEALAGRKTIVMVAHRLSSVRKCDAIWVMEGGRVVECGRYDDLIASSQRFRALAASA